MTLMPDSQTQPKAEQNLTANGMQGPHDSVQAFQQVALYTCCAQFFVVHVGRGSQQETVTVILPAGSH